MKLNVRRKDSLLHYFAHLVINYKLLWEHLVELLINKIRYRNSK